MAHKGKGVIYPTNTKKSSGMSTTRMTSGQSGSMSKAHGVTNGGGKHKTLKNASGALGSDVKTIYPKGFKEGPCPIGKKGY